MPQQDKYAERWGQCGPWLLETDDEATEEGGEGNDCA
jgi:hypothetical protein